MTADFWRSPFEAEQGEDRANTYRRPLVTLSFMIDHALYGDDARGYHLTNLLLHLLAVALAFWLSSRLLPEAPWAATAATAVFALHPTRVEAVAWISGRSELLLALGAVTALLLFRRALVGGRGKGPILMLAYAAAGAAFLCKETAVALVLVVPALDRLLVSRDEPGRFRRHLYLCHLPLLAAGLAFVAMRAPWSRLFLDGTGDGETLSWRLIRPLWTLGHYLSMLVVPYVPSIQIGAHADPGHPDWLLVLFGAAMVLVGGVLIFWLWRQRPVMAFGLVLFWAFLLPVANILPHGLRVLAAERFLYLPALGLGLVVGVILAEVRGQPRWSVPTAIVLLAVMVSWLPTVVSRSLDFEDVERFWNVELRRDPGNPDVLMELGQEAIRRGKPRRGEALLVKAWHHLERIQAAPRYQVPVLLRILDAHLLHLPRGDIRGRMEVALRLGELRSSEQTVVVRLHGQTLRVPATLAEVAREFVRRRPVLDSMRGVIESELGNDAAALALLDEAAAGAPAMPEIWLNQGLARLRALDHPGAVRALHRARNLVGDTPPIVALARAAEAAADRIRALRARGITKPEQVTSDAATIWLLCEIYSITGAGYRLQQLLGRMLELHSEDRRAWAFLANELASDGQPNQALSVVARARARFGDEPGLLRLEQRLRNPPASPSRE